MYIINDFRDKRAYNYTKRHSNKMWAWEFMRRNPDYQNFWDQTLATYKANFEEIKKGQRVAVFQIGRAPSMHNRPLPDITALDALRDADSLDFGIRHLRALEKWGTTFLYHPLNNEPQWYEKDNIYEWHDLPNIDLLAHEALVKIDFTKPIPGQLKQHKKLLLEMQEKGRYLKAARKRIKPLECYLRILDAEAEGISLTDAAEVIFTEPAYSTPAARNTRYSNCLSRAIQLVKDDYKKFL